MEKKITYAFGKKIFLLGKDQEGKLRWLEAPSWDCGWYWGFGYVESYTNNENPSRAKDICEHTHFSSLFLNGEKMAYDAFNEFFKETPLKEDEVWKLLELFQTAYTLRRSAEVFNLGGSHFTTNPCKDILKNKEMEDKINKELLPAVFKEIEKILSPEEA